MFTKHGWYLFKMCFAQILQTKSHPAYITSTIQPTLWCKNSSNCHHFLRITWHCIILMILSIFSCNKRPLWIEGQVFRNLSTLERSLERYQRYTNICPDRVHFLNNIAIILRKKQAGKPWICKGCHPKESKRKLTLT